MTLNPPTITPAQFKELCERADALVKNNQLSPRDCALFKAQWRMKVEHVKETANEQPPTAV